jgi:hypothetical protein
MTSGNIIELLIIAVIVIGIGAAIWRGGARNPVGTGGLEKKVAALTAKVGSLDTRLGEIEKNTASPADVRRVEKAIDKLAGSLPDIEARQRALSDKQGEHAATSAATAAKVDHIDRSIQLIMSVVVPKGMSK